MHTLKSLQKDLADAGIRPDDTLLVHSSMKKIGLVEGGADTVIDTFIDYFHQHGLIVFPSLTYTLAHVYDPDSPRCQKCGGRPGYCLAKGWQGRTPEFHANSTPACIGLLPNLFLSRPNIFRSLNPTHSLAACGPDAEEFTRGHELGNTPCGKHSPWWKLYLRHAKILHLGSTIHNTTYLHAVDEWRRAPDDPQGWLEQQCDVYDRNERRVDIPKLRNTSGSSGLYHRIEPRCEAEGALTRHRIGDADALLLDCQKLTDIALDELKKNPDLFQH